jgi:dolichyl-phosphate beta-glucosyltransferase
MLLASSHHTIADVSIIIPVYNGSQLLQKHLSPLLAFLHQQPYTVEVILTDDGSADKTATEEFAQTNQLKITGCQQNTGKGAVLREGFKLATGSVQLFTDADIPFEHNNIHTLILALQKDPKQLIIGDRMDPQSVYFKNAPLLRNMGSYVVSGLVSNLLFKGVYDTQCGLKGMGKQVAIELLSQTKVNRFAIDIELIYLASKQKIPVTKMPVNLRYNDKSSVRIVSDGWQLLKDIFRVKRMHG